MLKEFLEATLDGEIFSHLDKSERILGINVKDFTSYILLYFLLNYREILGSCFFRTLRAKTWLIFYVIEEGAEQAPGFG